MCSSRASHEHHLSPSNTCILLCTALEILGVGSLKAHVQHWEVDSCIVVFLAGHFLFSCSDIFAIGRVI